MHLSQLNFWVSWLLNRNINLLTKNRLEQNEIYPLLSKRSRVLILKPSIMYNLSMHSIEEKVSSHEYWSPQLIYNMAQGMYLVPMHTKSTTFYLYFLPKKLTKKERHIWIHSRWFHYLFFFRTPLVLFFMIFTHCAFSLYLLFSPSLLMFCHFPLLCRVASYIINVIFEIIFEFWNIERVTFIYDEIIGKYIEC